MQLLPTGRQNFKAIIEENLLYVDKRKELFEDLYIGKETDYAWDAYPVLQFNFADFGLKVNDLEAELLNLIEKYANIFSIDVPKDSLSTRMITLVEKISQKGKPVVILIDEYDKPIVDFLSSPETARKHQQILRRFFGTFKGLEARGHLHFLFITGVSKFSKVSLFSDLNNLEDLTIDPTNADLVGITREELLANFQPYIEHSAKALDLSKEQLLEGVQLWYNGYSYDGKTFLYNPFSLLNFFRKSSFQNFWFATGTPTFLVETLRDSNLPAQELETIEVPTTFFDKFSIDTLDIYNLLFQTGYLTIKKTRKRGFQHLFKLGYPNEEVRQAFTQNLLEAFTFKVASTVGSGLIKIETALQNGNVSSFIEQLKILLADISYHLHPKSKKNPSEKEIAKAFAAWEGYFQTIIYLICTFLNLQVQTEITKHKGRLDLLVETADFLYLMEFKLDQPVENAIAQIKSRQYIQSYSNSAKTIYLVGIGFSKEERNVENWEVEEWKR